MNAIKWKSQTLLAEFSKNKLRLRKSTFDILAIIASDIPNDMLLKNSDDGKILF